MALGERDTFQRTVEGVERWIPGGAHDRETAFQNELQEFLDEYLNESSGTLDMGGGDDYVVRREYGSIRADVAVDGIVGIEMKRDLSNQQTNTLRGQIEEYLDEFSFVIVCACGIGDMDGWRHLKNKYEGQQGLGLEGGEVAFVHKKKENYGKDPSSISDQGDGLLGGDGFL